MGSDGFVGRRQASVAGDCLRPFRIGLMAESRWRRFAAAARTLVGRARRRPPATLGWVVLFQRPPPGRLPAPPYRPSTRPRPLWWRPEWGRTGDSYLEIKAGQPGWVGVQGRPTRVGRCSVFTSGTCSSSKSSRATAPAASGTCSAIALGATKPSWLLGGRRAARSCWTTRAWPPNQ